MTAEFFRRYYILKIVSNPKYFGIYTDKYVSNKELQRVLDKKYEDFKNNTFLGKLKFNGEKTLRRDLKSIKEYFGVEIKLKRNYGYYVQKGTISQEMENVFYRIEHLLISTKAAENNFNITPEKATLNTTIDLLSLINAIENNFLVHISYKGWYDDNKFECLEKQQFQPLHIKEKNKAWYLIAYAIYEKEIKTFCLDKRLVEIQIFNIKVQNPIKFNEQDYFKYSIGILNEGLKVEKIKIKVANHHLKYLIAQPIHKSQKIIAEAIEMDTNELNYANPDMWGEIEVTLKVNYEFVMEMLKYNQWVKIVSPKPVVDFFKEHLNLIVKYYN
ncbi:WYL domain-containing protein [Lutibacter sp. HS1-25]|uniref:helix-turn-helix transcriptional regulator n=1 Tax=Lutibacter sp. HS1-25 TaxID=2485000 RepID=UPI0010113FCF|nr:WYL domain-containing protein [Lutibacter sp. HS1-25]RXP63504.1 WYL domain-containing protein [Lutibacter sp. HS1-25]